MNDEKRFTLDEVRAAFKTLEDHVAGQAVDAGCVWAVHYAAEDVLSILVGEWQPEKAADPGDDEEVLG